MPIDNLAAAMEAAVAHHQRGELQQAEQLYRAILQRQPNMAPAIHLLGVLAHQTGNNPIALELIGRAIAIDPTAPEFYSNLSSPLIELGRIDEAIAVCEKAVRLNPAFVDGLNNLASALRKAGRHADAIEILERSLKLQPNNAGVLLTLTGAYQHQENPQKVIEHCQNYLRINPANSDVYHAMAIALAKLRRDDEAIAGYKKAIELRPDFPEAWNDLGLVYELQWRMEEATAAYRKSIECRPEYPQPWNNLANVQERAGDYADAEESFRKSILYSKDAGQPRVNLGMLFLRSGRFAEGWEQYEWRTKCVPMHVKDEKVPHPRWSGQDLKGKRIFLHVEQGFGDTFHFIRYAKRLEEMGGHVLLGCHDEVASLMQRVRGVHELVRQGQPMPDFDYHSPLLSLPAVFKTDLTSIPLDLPYITPDPALVELWRSRIDGGGKFKVALAWAGKPSHTNDLRRSMTLAALAPLARVPGVRFFSLQKGNAAEEVKNPPAGMDIVDLGNQLQEFGQTAAVLSLVDLLISVDTSVVHLSGAMNRPAWMFTPFVPDWRWLLDREDSPWYPSLRLFRTKMLGRWQDTIERVAGELARHVANK